MSSPRQADDLQSNLFDSNDEITYYFGNLSRDEVKDVLNDAPIGTFLIRDSTKDLLQKVLCVKEATKVINSYKIIQRPPSSDETKNADEAYYLFGKEDCLFKSIPAILDFYSTHYLNQSPLVRAAFHHKKVIGLFDFSESDDPSEDLYFKEGETLTILEYTQGNEWWKAQNENGSIGLIPVPLVRRLKPNEIEFRKSNIPLTESKTEEIKNISEKEEAPSSPSSNSSSSLHQPLDARVIEDYTPSPYEHSHIALRKGQLLKVVEMRSNGKWLGQLSDGKTGLFPFNRVELI